MKGLLPDTSPELILSKNYGVVWGMLYWPLRAKDKNIKNIKPHRSGKGHGVILLECPNYALRRGKKTSQTVLNFVPFTADPQFLFANAGVMATSFGHTAHGFETQFGTNHLGHFVLVNRIAALMGAGSRLINLSSSGHRYSNVDLDGAILLRNSLILAILVLQAFAFCLVPMLIMLAATAILPHFSP